MKWISWMLALVHRAVVYERRRPATRKTAAADVDIVAEDRRRCGTRGPTVDEVGGSGALDGRRRRRTVIVVPLSRLVQEQLVVVSVLRRWLQKFGAQLVMELVRLVRMRMVTAGRRGTERRRLIDDRRRRFEDVAHVGAGQIQTAAAAVVVASTVARIKRRSARRRNLRRRN